VNADNEKLGGLFSCVLCHMVALGEIAMVLVTVMYPNQSGSTFNHDYYLQKHIPLVKERWSSMGLDDIRLVRGVGTPDGSEPPYQVMALLSFRSMPEFQNAASAHAEELFADIPNFTNVQPVVQISEDLASTFGR
jgi:uncharacterized protein (TIGR02118 family)